jgi:hypothetical protein
VVVAGGKKFKEMCKKKGWIWVADVNEKIKGKLLN